jgi:predicted enzyme related to lactoylglutathione lyase/uncharacterized protein YndB with AHSA1/START domain
MNPSVFSMSETFPIAANRMFDLWTSPEHLKNWFGPAGAEIVRHTLDLRPGGSYHFCLKTPDGNEMWGKWAFREITAPTRLVWIHSFSDEAGGLTKHPMSETWPLEMVSTVTFLESGAATTVALRWEAHNASAIEQQTFDNSHESMRQGWGGTFSRLRDYVAKLANRRQLMNPVVHFELPYDDRARMAKFYESASGWQTRMLGADMGNYVLATTTETGETGPNNPGAINGGFYPKKADWPAQYPSVVIAVDDIGESMRQVLAAGGRVLGEAMEIPTVGRYVSFIDTEGNRISILQPVAGNRHAQTPK